MELRFDGARRAPCVGVCQSDHRLADGLAQSCHGRFGDDAGTDRGDGVALRDVGPWLTEYKIGARRPAARVHVGSCRDTRTRCKAATADLARCALSEGVEACPACRPDTAMGVLERPAALAVEELAQVRA
ncbi:DUF6233 domain-containing protein [Streptomyces sp. NBC_01276]|uniref:DUF6233 domain-containing protein n=1 Tax=Streptomyces sp. NBC_01276 TaxID=2903808 RepID=UPI002F911CEE